MRRFWHDNSLAIVIAACFVVILAGQSFAGWREFNDEQRVQHARTESYTRYLVSSDFHDNVMQNWQSEFLQIALYTMFAVWFRQRGSAESQDPDHPVRQSDEDELLGSALRPDSPAWARAGGWRLRIYENSLLLSMTTLFFLSWLAQAVTEHNVYNNQQHLNKQPLVGFANFIGTSYFWERTLQNWQSEFLAVGVFAVATIYLRQRESTESKPVGAPHSSTGS